MKMIKKLIIPATVALALCLNVSIAFANGPCGNGHDQLSLFEKDPATWAIVQGGASGKLEYDSAGPTFDFKFNGRKLNPNGAYTLIYYPDPWPGAGLFCLANGTANAYGKIQLEASVNPDSDLPITGDLNSPAGAKIWLVLSSDVDCGGQQMVGWNPTEYLFENNLIKYDDTDLPEVVDTVDIKTIPAPVPQVDPPVPATVDCSGRCISFNPEQPGNWGGEYLTGAVTAFLGDNDPAGYVILNANKFKPQSVNIRHLDGITLDDFDVFVLDALGTWVNIGHYADNGIGDETWLVTPFSLLLDALNNPIKLAGANILIKIVPTTLLPPWWGFDTWGQLAISQVELLGLPRCPDCNGYHHRHHYGHDRDRHDRD